MQAWRLRAKRSCLRFHVSHSLQRERPYERCLPFLSDDCGDNSDELSCANYIMCDFEEPTDLCDWKQDDDNNLDWELGDGETSSFETGPKRDHTLGLPSGHYIFLEASSPAEEGDRARIASPVLNRTGDECLFRFYYHMYGEVSRCPLPMLDRHQLSLIRLGYRCTQYLQSHDVRRHGE